MGEWVGGWSMGVRRWECEWESGCEGGRVVARVGEWENGWEGGRVECGGKVTSECT